MQAYLEASTEASKEEDKERRSLEAVRHEELEKKDFEALTSNLARLCLFPTYLLQEKISLLRVMNVFFLLNVDSYTRDDLMSMIAAKVSFFVALQPKLFLDPSLAEALGFLFQYLNVSKELLEDLSNPEAIIYECFRTGQWIVSDEAYRQYRRMDITKHSEPLDRIAKSLSIQSMDLSGVQNTLHLIALFLSPPPGDESVRASSAERLLQALVELCNSCARAVYHENLSSKLLKDQIFEITWTERMNAQRVARAKHLSFLEKVVFDPEMLPYSENFENRRDVQIENWSGTKTLVFFRLLLLCVLRLQLMNLSCYGLTPVALKLASLLCDEKTSPESLKIYWLFVLHRGLNSLGFDLQLLRDVLELFKQEKTPLLFSGPRHSTVKEAASVFEKLRHRFKGIGKQKDSGCILNFFKKPKVSKTPYTEALVNFFEEALKKMWGKPQPVSAKECATLPPHTKEDLGQSVGFRVLEEVSENWLNPQKQESNEHLSAALIYSEWTHVNHFWSML